MKSNKNINKEAIYSQVINAGKRTYFFDVRKNQKGEKYITITESRKQFLNDNGKIVFEKTKLFLYKEDYEKFVKGLSEAINFAREGETSDSDFLLDEDSIFDEKINSI